MDAQMEKSRKSEAEETKCFTINQKTCRESLSSTDSRAAEGAEFFTPEVAIAQTIMREYRMLMDQHL